VLAGDALKWRTSMSIDWLTKDTKYRLDLRRNFHSEAKLATLKFLCRPKKLPPSALKQKDPGFGRFSRSSFERVLILF
jgi:hypothetical protein